MARSDRSLTLPSPAERLAGVVGGRPVVAAPQNGGAGPPTLGAPAGGGANPAPARPGGEHGAARPRTGSSPWSGRLGPTLIDPTPIDDVVVRMPQAVSDVAEDPTSPFGVGVGVGVGVGEADRSVRSADDGVDRPPAPELPPTGLDRLRAGLTRAVAAWIPAGWRPARVDPGRPAATALALVAAAAAVVAAVGVWMERPQAVPVPALPVVSVSGSPTDPTSPAGTSPIGASLAGRASAGVAAGPASRAAAGPSAAAAAGPLVVSVSGRVRRPGLVRVPDGARVADVLDAAGGALPGTDLTTLNLARRVGDGEQVAVGVPAAPDAGGGGGTGSGAPGAEPVPTGPLDLNAATIGQLDALPGVGPVTAQRIVDWRTHNGHFARVDQLREVAGIGEQKFAQLRDLVRV